jgi:hypothetical protein
MPMAACVHTVSTAAICSGTCHGVTIQCRARTERNRGSAEKPVGELGAGDIQHHQHRIDRPSTSCASPSWQSQMPDVDRPQRIQHVNRQRGASSQVPVSVHQTASAGRALRWRPAARRSEMWAEVTEHECEQDEPADQPRLCADSWGAPNGRRIRRVSRAGEWMAAFEGVKL